MCDKDCVENPYYQNLVTQKACSPKGLPSVDVAVYAETRKCAPCQNKENWRSCGFPTWEQFDKLDCTFKGLNRTYGKLVPARLMTDVMLPGMKSLRGKKSASDSRLRRVPCKKKGAGGLRGATSDTQLGGKSKSGKGKSTHTGKAAGQSGKGGRKTGGGGHGGGGHGGGGRGGGGHGGGGNVGQTGGKSTKNSKSKKGGKHQQGKEDGYSYGTRGNEPITDGKISTEIDHRSELGPDENGENILTYSLMNSGVLTLTPLQERDGKYYFNFNIRNPKPNPDLNLNINVQDGIFLGENKLTTEIRYRLEHTFDEALKNN